MKSKPTAKPEPATTDLATSEDDTSAQRYRVFAEDRRLRDEAKLKMLRTALRRRPDEIPVELVEHSIVSCEGNLTKAAKDLEVSFARLAHMVDGSRVLTALVMRQRETLVDMAEDVLRSHLVQGDLKAATFTLRTLGKDRGFVERTDSARVVDVNVRNVDVDLSKLSTDQLRALKTIRAQATSRGDSTVTDVEFEEVSK
jgi:hypothetical protein